MLSTRYALAFVLIQLTLLTFPSNAQLFPKAGRSSFEANQRPTPLPLDEAFPFHIGLESSDLISVTWIIAEDHYLYKHGFSFALKDAGTDTTTQLEFSLPDARLKTDEFFGETEVYYDRVQAHVQLDPLLKANSLFIVSYQGCADWGFCYPPQSSEIRLNP